MDSTDDELDVKSKCELEVSVMIKDEKREKS